MQIEFPSNILKGTFSVKKNKDGKYIKGKIQRIHLANNEIIQISLFTDKQVFHVNCNDNDITIKLNELLENEFNNLELTTKDFIYSYRITSKGKLLNNKRKNNEIVSISDHNKKKQYILEEGMIIPPLIDLGVMLDDGRIVKASYDKFKQINRFIEIIDDSIKDEKKLSIIDFGCGKSYLTFILYYYFTVIKKIDVNIIGLDLKEDVIDNCNKISEKYGYKNLKFYKGNIADYAKTNNVDMIVTLHACDTATDYALYHAINMKCRYIFSVPCCQHEINNQLSKNFNINLFIFISDRILFRIINDENIIDNNNEIFIIEEDEKENKFQLIRKKILSYYNSSNYNNYININISILRKYFPNQKEFALFWFDFN